MLLRGAYCVSFDNAAIAQITNNLVTWADLYNETSAQRCAKGECRGEGRAMRVVLCGDLLFSSRNLKNRLDKRVVDLLVDADAVFANAEFSTPKRNTPPGLCMYLTSVRQDILDELTDLNIKLVSFANNHTIDYGPQGCLETIEAAEARDIIPCGVGRNLWEARKARFLDTAQGRVAVVACSSTWAERALASNENADVVARPGLCPLRWGRSYVLPSEQFEQLRAIDAMLGTDKSFKEVSKIETWEPPTEDAFKFGSAMSGNLQIERGDRAYVRDYVNESDQEAILESIRDAARRSDVVIATLHTHEGENENWYATYAPKFVEEFARKTIDAGATCFVGQGAHFPRGVEVYKGCPIFYNLGSLLMEFESGESMISPEMYETHHLGPDAHPSDLHSNRAQKPDGSWNGFYSERRFSTNFLVVLDIDEEGANYEIVPLDLDMHREDNLKRGLPEVSTPEEGKKFADYLAHASERYGVAFAYCEETGAISFDA